MMESPSKEKERKEKEEKEKKKKQKEQIENLVSSESILKESGDEGLLLQAFSDQSSVICKHCKGLIKKERLDSHIKMWCPGIERNEEDEEDD